MYNINARITSITTNSPAYFSELRVGDVLLSVDGRADYTDIIELRNAFAEEILQLEVLTANGEKSIVTVEKYLDEDLGLVFDSAVFDGVRECHNNCKFCFVNQMPQGLRESLYVKDDDYRLSFLYGNFVTLTNLTEQDKQRIYNEHLTPLYISVHATNPAVRVELMNNKYAGEILHQLREFKERGISFHTQLVLCPGYNDAAVLQESVEQLLSLYPAVLSIAAVPVGLTKYRDDLPQLRTFTRTECAQIIEATAKIQEHCRATLGRTFVYLSDEFYVGAELPVPMVQAYDDFPQLENGIGLTRLFLQEWEQTAVGTCKAGKKLIIVGKSAEKIVGDLVTDFNALHNTAHKVYAQTNEFFGRNVTVTGLLTAGDLGRAIAAHPDYSEIIIPEVCLRKGEAVFLDNITFSEFCQSQPDKRIIAVAGGGKLKRILCEGVS